MYVRMYVQMYTVRMYTNTWITHQGCTFHSILLSLYTYGKYTYKNVHITPYVHQYRETNGTPVLHICTYVSILHVHMLIDVQCLCGIRIYVHSHYDHHCAYKCTRIRTYIRTVCTYSRYRLVLVYTYKLQECSTYIQTQTCAKWSLEE